jgi:hypothetical protein
MSFRFRTGIADEQLQRLLDSLRFPPTESAKDEAGEQDNLATREAGEAYRCPYCHWPRRHFIRAVPLTDAEQTELTPPNAPSFTPEQTELAATWFTTTQNQTPIGGGTNMDNGQAVTMPTFIRFVEAVFDLIDRYGGYRKFGVGTSKSYPARVWRLPKKSSG